MKQFGNGHCKIHFYSAVYNFKVVFYQQLEGTTLCNPNFGVKLLNCDGQEIISYAENEKNIFENEVTDLKLIHICE